MSLKQANCALLRLTMNETEIVINFDHATTGYDKRTILQDVNFSIQKGEFVYLIGKTGAGKSSILKMMYGDLRPLRGNVRIGSFNIGKLKGKEVPFLRRKLGIVFQDFQLLPDRTVEENIKFVMRATGWKDKQKMSQRTSELLVKVGLGAKLKSKPHQLSGGEQQRVAIARAMVNDPMILLADEPTGNLDPEATQNIMEILFKINLAGTAILMATHEHELIETYPARTLECSEGGVIDHKIYQPKRGNIAAM